MSIVIHVGTHKTGTTSLQKFAAVNRDYLRENGLWYPSYTEIGLFDHYAHHHLAFAVSDMNDKKLTDGDARRFLEMIEKQRQPDETVLISAEPLCRLTSGGGAGVNRWKSSAAAYWDARNTFLERLREFFPTDDVEVLICLRRQDSFARSVYQERIKVTKYRDTFATFLHKDRGIFDYLGQVELFARHFPSVRIAVFESLTSGGDLHTAFFGLLGIDISEVEDHPIKNVSLPIEFVEFKRLLNMTPIDNDFAKQIGKKLAAMAANNELSPDRNLDWLPQEDIFGFQGSFEQDNEELRRRFADDLPAPLFPPPEKTTKQVFRELPVRRAMEIASRFIE